MNKVFPAAVLAACAIFMLTDPSKMLPAAVAGANDAVRLSLSLLALYAIWLGLLRVAEAAGLNGLLAKLLKRPIRFLFGKQTEETYGYLAMNISANMLGMGNAATPMGIKAMESMDGGRAQASAAMIMLMVINSTSLQLLPTTMIGLRASEGSMSASDILFPTLIASVTATAVGVALCKVCERVFKKKKDE
ncbi:MAG: spore maturation protein [Firmicutes bacterium]|nr:spore maturation protein [Bacillota bacterium]